MSSPVLSGDVITFCCGRLSEYLWYFRFWNTALNSAILSYWTGFHQSWPDSFIRNQWTAQLQSTHPAGKKSSMSLCGKPSAIFVKDDTISYVISSNVHTDTYHEITKYRKPTNLIHASVWPIIWNFLTVYTFYFTAAWHELLVYHNCKPNNPLYE